MFRPPKFSNWYERLRWIVLLLVGAVLDMFAIRLFSIFYAGALHGLLIAFGVNEATYLQSAADWVLVPIAFVLPVIPLFLMPIVLSVTLTKQLPERQIVPAFYMQLLAAVFLVLYVGAVNLENTLGASGGVMLGLYVLFGGVVQDRIATSFTGITADRSNIITFAVEIDAPPETIARLLTREPFNIRFGFPRKFQQETNALVISNGWAAQYRIIFKIHASTKNASKSILAAAFHERTSYYLRKSDDLYEISRVCEDYLRDLFSREGQKAKMNAPDVRVARPLINSLIDSIIDETQGMRLRMVRASAAGWLKLVGLAAIVIAVGALFVVLKSYPEAVATGVLFLLYLLYDLPAKIKRD